LIEWYFNEEYRLEREVARKFKMTRKDMEEEGNELMLKACFQPSASPIASAVFNAISSYASETSIVIGGMGFSFQGIDKLKLIENAKKFRNINLTRYEPYIDMFANGLREIYNVKDKKDGN
jgi:hypothetical protein